MDKPQQLLSKRDLARWLRIKVERVDALVREHGLPAIRIPCNKRDTVRFDEATVRRWLEERQDGLPL